MAQELDFRVAIKLATDQFNTNLKESSQNFASSVGKMGVILKELEVNSHIADKALSTLFKVEGNNLPTAIEKATKELEGLKSGANITQAQLTKAFGISAKSVQDLTNTLAAAKQKLNDLGKGNIKVANVDSKEIKELEQALKKAQQASLTFEKALTDALMRGNNSALQTKKTLEQVLNIPNAQGTVSQINNMVTALSRLENVNSTGSAKMSQQMRVFTDTAIVAVRNMVSEINSNTAAAHTALRNLFKVNPSNLTGEIKEVTSALNAMRTGANLAETHLVRALNLSTDNVKKLTTELNKARTALNGLSGNTNPADVTAAVNNVKKLEQELQRATTAATAFGNAMTAAMDRVNTSATTARNTLHNLMNMNAGQGSLTQLNALVASLGHLNASSASTTTTLNAQMQQLNTTVTQLTTHLNSVGGQLNNTTESVERVGRATNQASQSSMGFNQALGSLRNVLGMLGLSVGVSQLIEMADAYKSLEARVKLATGEGANFIAGFHGVNQIANETFSSLEDTGNLFARITRAGEAMHLAQSQVLQVTRTVNEAIKLSGGSAESNQAAITQLLQGLQSGVLRGEEFNSVMEQSPRLARALADGLGVTIGQLRGMANQGKLTSEVVIGALQKQSSVIQAEFDKMPMTVGNSLQLLKNKFLVFIGELDGQLNSSGGLAAMIRNVADAFDNIDSTSLDSVKGVFNGIKDAIVAVVNILHEVYDRTNEFVNAIGGVSEKSEQVGILTRAMQVLSVSIGVIADGFKLIGITFDGVAGGILKGFGYITESIAQYFGYTNTFAKDAMAKGNELLAQATKNALDFKSSTTAALDSAAQTQEQRLQEVANTAKATYDKMEQDDKVSNEKKQAAFIAYANAVIAANKGVVDAELEQKLQVQGLAVEYDKAGKAQIVSADSVKKSFIDLYNEGQKSGKSYWDSLLDASSKAKSEADFVDMRATLKFLADEGKITGAELAKGLQQVEAEHDKYQAKIEANTNAFADFAQKSIQANKGIISSELEKEAAARGYRIEMDEQGKVYITLASAGVKSAQEISKEYATTAKGLGVDFSKATMGVSESFKKPIEDLKTLSGHFGEFGQAGIDASQVVTQAFNKMLKEATNPAEIDYLIQEIIKMGNEGKISGTQMQVALDEARNKANQLKGEVDGVTHAYQLMGLETKKQLAEKAQEYTEAFNVIKKDGTATASQLESAFTKQAQAVIAANKDTIPSWLQAQAAAMGLVVTVDKSGRVSVESAEKATKANEQTATSLNHVSTSASRAGNAVASAGRQAAQAWEEAEQSISKANRALSEKSAEERKNRDEQNGAAMKASQNDISQYSTATGMEGFLKSAGLSEEQAKEEVRKLMVQFGKNGRMDWNAARGVRAGQSLTPQEFMALKSPSAYLLDIAEKLRYQQNGSLGGSPNSEAMANIANTMIPPAIKPVNVPVPSNTGKTVNLNLKLGNKTVNAQIPDNQSSVLEALVKELEAGKAISGQ